MNKGRMAELREGSGRGRVREIGGGDRVMGQFGLSDGLICLNLTPNLIRRSGSSQCLLQFAAVSFRIRRRATL